MLRCQLYFILALLFYSTTCFSQIKDTTSLLSLEKLDTITVKLLGTPSTRWNGKVIEYRIDSKKVSKIIYDSCIAALDIYTGCHCYLVAYGKKGQLLKEGAQITIDTPIGPQIHYYSNGKIESKGDIKLFYLEKENRNQLAKDGIWEYYRMDGSLRKRETYKDMQLISTK